MIAQVVDGVFRAPVIQQSNGQLSFGTRCVNSFEVDTASIKLALIAA